MAWLYPVDPAQRGWHSWIEHRVIKYASKVVLTTRSAKREYSARYPEAPDSQWAYISNGYDEAVFAEIERDYECTRQSSTHGPLQLVHSGVLYPDERDPTAFFEALGELKKKNAISNRTLHISLRATGHDELYVNMLAANQISDIVSLEPPIGYREALLEMLEADGLLLFQASNCNHQIPAKLYEYLRAQRPIFALTDQAGDTAAMLKEAKLNNIAPIDDAKTIQRKLLRFCYSIRSGRETLCDLATAR